MEQNEHQNDPFYHKINNTNDSIETSQDDSDKISHKYDMYPIKGPPEATASWSVQSNNPSSRIIP